MQKIFKTTLTLLIFIFLTIGFLHPITAITQDLGRHFLLGRLILQTHHVPKTNLLSYTNTDFPFVDTDWLSSVVFYLVFTIANYNGLLLFTIFFMLAGFAILFFYKFKSSNIFALSLICLLYINILFERTDVRPEIFSFFFLSVFVTILYYYRKSKTRLIFLLPFLELLWVNLHIYFIIGIAVIGMFFIDSLLSELIQRSRYHQGIKNTLLDSILLWKNKHIIILFFILVASCFATFVNPNFISGALYPFSVFKNYGYPIEENQNLFFLWQYFATPTATMVTFMLSVLFLFSSMALTFKRTQLIDWMLAIFFTVFGISAIRNIPLLAIATFIPFVNSLSIIINKTLGTKIRPQKFIILSSLFIMLFVWQIINRTNTTSPGFGVATGAKNALDFFQKENLKGPIFNNFDIGSYVEYRLFPKEQTFVDGRPEAYPTAFFQKIYIPMQQDPLLFKKVDQKYHFSTIVFSYTDQTPWAQKFLASVVNNNNWSMIYLDDYMVIFVKNNVVNNVLIQKLTMNQYNLHISNVSEKNEQSLTQLAYFFSVVNWQKQEEKVLQQLVNLNPHNCPALLSLVTILQNQNTPVNQIYASRYQSFCK